MMEMPTSSCCTSLSRLSMSSRDPMPSSAAVRRCSSRMVRSGARLGTLPGAKRSASCPDCSSRFVVCSHHDTRHQLPNTPGVKEVQHLAEADITRAFSGEEMCLSALRADLCACVVDLPVQALVCGRAVGQTVPHGYIHAAPSRGPVLCIKATGPHISSHQISYLAHGREDDAGIMLWEAADDAGNLTHALC